MPSRKHRFSKCQHLGHGTECRRCLQAQMMRAKASSMKEGQAQTDLLNEAARLESADGRPIMARIEETVTES